MTARTGMLNASPCRPLGPLSVTVELEKSRPKSQAATSAASPATEDRSSLNAAISSEPSARPMMVGLSIFPL